MHQDIIINVDYKKVNIQVKARPVMRTFLLYDNKSHPAIAILPGGGYRNLAPHEADDIALKFNQLGFHVFVVRYSCADIEGMHFPGQMLEVLSAIGIIRQHCEEWNVLSRGIFICGFSAGGHLAGCVGTMWNRSFVKNTLGTMYSLCKPDGMILCYPVISSNEQVGGACVSTLKNLLKEKYNEQKDMVSLEKQVAADTIPAFIWHTYTDPGVFVDNSLLMATALRRNKVPFEMHIFPLGGHGLGLAESQPECMCWPDIAARWCKTIF